MKLEKGQCCIYWIRAKHHTDVFSEGYIGVSVNPEKRWYWHLWKSRRGDHENPALLNAINKYGWDSLIKQILIIGSEDYCYEIEGKIRSKDQIGWNILVGGSKPPKTKPRGKNYISPLKGKSRQTPWMIGRIPVTAGMPMSEEKKAIVSKTFKGKKQSPEQVAKRVASRRATLQAQGRTV